MQPRNSCAVASWFDLDGIALVEFHSKANALDADSMAILDDALTQVEAEGLRGLIVHNDAQHFSCGVNLQAVRSFFLKEDMDGLDKFLQDFQNTVHRMQTASFPVVAAPVGLSIGGGFEVVLHARQVICHANSVTGLVESLVGVVPGGGGCKETLYRLEQTGFDRWSRVTRYDARLQDIRVSTSRRFVRATSCIGAFSPRCVAAPDELPVYSFLDDGLYPRPPDRPDWLDTVSDHHYD